ncbi:hypothetical protein LGQ03_11885 [Loktanella sp. TSTF-M6]|uniref:DUF2127 domain-containing protein n=1 Tax=Loktanella gaetbuli TaxID=2881335 RepID=A0ABS8BW64_9RHOB|nr:hypothetical protein [Loktanella gaetbuli]MCB5199939.1 hypothetical protein [Loktanella gaetbuli]
MQKHALLLKISAVLWVIWGIVHVGAGIFIVGSETPAAVAGIADAMDPAQFDIAYPAAVSAIVKQLGFNIGWAGIVTLVGAVFIWRRNAAAIFVTALVGGLFDLAYLLFIDLGGFALFLPGGLMTYVSASAILLSFYAYFASTRA